MASPLIVQPDSATGNDNYIQGRTDLSPDRRICNSGAYNLMLVGCDTSDNMPCRSLLRIPITGLPAGVTIDSATLELYCVSEGDTTNRVVYVHRSLVQFYQGLGPTTGTVPDAGVDASTWAYRNYNGSVAWNSAGGGSGTDYVATATASANITAPSTAFTFDVKADVAAWYAGTATNYGWFLINVVENTAGSRKRFATSDHATASIRPKLTIAYTEGGGSVSSIAAVMMRHYRHMRTTGGMSAMVEGASSFGYNFSFDQADASQYLALL